MNAAVYGRKADERRRRRRNLVTYPSTAPADLVNPEEQGNSHANQTEEARCMSLQELKGVIHGRGHSCSIRQGQDINIYFHKTSYSIQKAKENKMIP